MALPKITLEGNLVDGTYIRFNLSVDDDNIAITTSPSFGRIMVLDCNVDDTSISPPVAVWRQGWSPQNIYNKEAIVRIVSLQGWIGIPNYLNKKKSFSMCSPLTSVSNDKRFKIGFLLNDRDIEVIEDARNSTDLHLELYLSGIATIHSSTSVLVPKDKSTGLLWYPSETFSIASNNSSPVNGYGGNQITILRERWLLLLQASNIQRYLIELPIPNNDAYKDKWQQVVQTVKGAEDFHRRGEYEKTIENCRKVIEGVQYVLSNQWNIKKKSGQSFDGWTKELVERLKKAWPKEDEECAVTLGALISAIWSWTSPAHHFGGKMPVREESLFTLHLATNLLSFASQLLLSHPQPVVTQDIAES